MKVYMVYKESWRDSEEIDAICYEVAEIFDTKEKANKYLEEECCEEDYAYIDEREVL